MRSVNERLEDIIDAIVLIEAFLQEEPPSVDLAQDMSFWAIVKQIEIVGEAAKNIAKELREEYPKIPWGDLAKTRDRMSHGYFSLDPAQVMEIAKRLRDEVLAEVRRMRDVQSENASE